MHIAQNEIYDDNMVLVPSLGESSCSYQFFSTLAVRQIFTFWENQNKVDTVFWNLDNVRVVFLFIAVLFAICHFYRNDIYHMLGLLLNEFISSGYQSIFN